MDVKDAYLTVDQPSKVIIEVPAAIFDETSNRTITLVLDRLLPGQRIGASAWYERARTILTTAHPESFSKEPTLFRHSDPGNLSAMILHEKEEREKIIKTLGLEVTVQVGEPMKAVGDEFKFLKRKYMLVEEGWPSTPTPGTSRPSSRSSGPWSRMKTTPRNSRPPRPRSTRSRLDGFCALGTAGRTSSTASVCSVERWPTAKAFKWLLRVVGYYLAAAPDLGSLGTDIQYSICVLSGKMAKPTAKSFKWLLRVVGYLAAVPDLGFGRRPVTSGATFSYNGPESYHTDWGRLGRKHDSVPKEHCPELG